MYTLQGYTLTLSLLCPFLPRVRWCSILQLCLWWGRGASGTIPSQTLWILPSTFITSSSSQSCSTSLVSSLLPIPLQPTCSLVPRPSWQVKEGLAFWVAFFVTWDGGYGIKTVKSAFYIQDLSFPTRLICHVVTKAATKFVGKGENELQGKFIPPLCLCFKYDYTFCTVLRSQLESNPVEKLHAHNTSFLHNKIIYKI